MAGLLLCICAGALYQQPPMRKTEEQQRETKKQRAQTLPKHSLGFVENEVRSA